MHGVGLGVPNAPAEGFEAVEENNQMVISSHGNDDVELVILQGWYASDTLVSMKMPAQIAVARVEGGECPGGDYIKGKWA